MELNASDLIIISNGAIRSETDGPLNKVSLYWVNILLLLLLLHSINGATSPHV